MFSKSHDSLAKAKIVWFSVVEPGFPVEGRQPESGANFQRGYVSQNFYVKTKESRPSKGLTWCASWICHWFFLGNDDKKIVSLSDFLNCIACIQRQKLKLQTLSVTWFLAYNSTKNSAARQPARLEAGGTIASTNIIAMFTLFGLEPADGEWCWSVPRLRDHPWAWRKLRCGDGVRGSGAGPPRILLPDQPGRDPRVQPEEHRQLSPVPTQVPR